MTDTAHTADGKDTVWIVYDGACPFCASYVQMVRLRDAVGDVQLVNARDGGPIVEEVLERGFDLDEGMAMKIGERYYHGAQVMQMIAMMSSDSGALNQLHAWVFRSPTRAKLLYPWLRTGRNAVLRLLGHTPLAEAGFSSSSKSPR